jgi:ESCRT-II complex subunit VPS22
MRRRVGVGAVKKKDQKAFSSVGKSMEAEKMSTVKETLEKFKESLSEFAEKHRQRINSDPEFRQQFHSMCVAVGVDPLASSKGFWADILGVGDFYFELGVKIIQTCVQTRNDNGGLMPMEDLLHKLRQQQQQQSAIGNAKNNNGSSSSSSPEISLADVHRAIEKLSVLGGGFRVIKMGGNSSRGGKGVKGAAAAVEYVFCSIVLPFFLFDVSVSLLSCIVPCLHLHL